MNNMRIDIISDVVCPWCVIGYKRLEKALLNFPELETDIRWHPFELNPDMPSGGENLREHLAQKYGTTLEGSIAARKRLTDIGDSLGFKFDYFDEMRMFNTFNAHQLLHWSRQFNKQTELKLRLFRAFFGERKTVDEIAVLTECADEVGLDKAQAKLILDKQTYADQVRASEQQWLQRGIRGVPAIIINQQYLISGAQEIETFESQITTLLTQAA